MSNNRIIKWILKSDNVRMYIGEGFDLIVKEKIKTKRGAYRFEMTAVIKRHEGQLAIWFPPNGKTFDGWMSKKVDDAAMIRSRYEIPLADEMLEKYDAVVMAHKLK